MPVGGYQVPGGAGPPQLRKVAPWEVATMLRKHGCPQKWLITMVAVAGAESNYYVNPPDKTGLNPHPLGLFQIYNHPSYNQDRLANDPDYNTQAAVNVLTGSGSPKPWQTYTNGGYSKFMATARAAVIESGQRVKAQSLPSWTVNSDDTSAAHDAAGAVGLGGAYEGVQGAGSAAENAVGVLTNPDTWVRVGQIVGGLVCVILGVVLLGRSQLSSKSTTVVEKRTIPDKADETSGEGDSGGDSQS